MSYRWSHMAARVAGAVLLAACVAHDPNAYAPPQGLAAQQGVTLLGSRGGSVFTPEYHAIRAIDGKLITDPVDRWDRPVVVTANEPHHVKAVYVRGTAVAASEFDVEGPPGSTYVVKAEDFPEQTSVRLWFEDAASGQIIGEKRLAAIDYVPTSIPAMSPTPSTIVTRAIR